MRTIAGLADVIANYSCLFVDVHGVLHDGDLAFHGAVEALGKARQQCIGIVIVTNSAERTNVVSERLGNAGFPRHLRDNIASSGELTWRYLMEPDAATGTLPKLFIVKEGEGPRWLSDLPHPIVADAGEADLMVAAGMPFRDEQAFHDSDYGALFRSALERKPPLIVADSDVTYPSHGKIRLGPGWLGNFYRDLGGSLVEFGKPHAPVFREALAPAGKPYPDDVLMIGDNLSTDIAGATGMGLHSLLVLNYGVSQHLTPADIAGENAGTGSGPTYVAQSLRW